MSTATATDEQRMRTSLRIALAAAVATATAIVWALVWDLGLSFVRLSVVLGAPVNIREPALAVGWYLQWILAALSLLLTFSLLARPWHIRGIVATWFVTLLLYALLGEIGFRDLTIMSLLSVLPAAGVFGWILYLTRVRPNTRLKLAAPVLKGSG